MLIDGSVRRWRKGTRPRACHIPLFFKLFLTFGRRWLKRIQRKRCFRTNQIRQFLLSAHPSAIHSVGEHGTQRDQNTLTTESFRTSHIYHCSVRIAHRLKEKTNLKIF
jgi:hypothetical protein